MHDELYFKPEVSDFWDGAKFVMVTHGQDLQLPQKDWIVLNLTYSVGSTDPFVVDRSRNSIMIGPYVYMKYLTSEDIDLFGFERINTPPWSYSTSMNTPYISWFIKGIWVISFAEKTRMMGIFQYSDTHRMQALHLSCCCRDINKFTLLVKAVMVEPGIIQKQLDDKRLIS